jgi:hypothetical protein
LAKVATEVSVGERIELSMVPGRGRGNYRRRNDLLHQVLRSSGYYRRKLRFRSREERLNYLIQLFKPHAAQIDAPSRHSITCWLKNQGLSATEIKRFYEEIT